MKLEIISIHGQGNQKEEYVLCEAKEDCDIGKFFLADSTYTSDNKLSNKLRNTFWFPDTLVKKGHLVSLWTGPGQSTTTRNEKGTPIHRFYWGLEKPVWNNTGDCAVLIEIGNWKSFSTKPA